MAVQVNPNPSMGVGIWLIWAGYLLVILVLLVRSFLSRWTSSLPFLSSPSNRPERSLSSQTLLDYFSNEKKFNGPVTLSCVLISTVVLASVVTNTPDDIYTKGFAAFAWLPALLFAVLGYLVVAARLSKLSAIRNYTSPIDFLNDRYRSKTMRAITGSVMVMTAVVFMAIMMKAAGSLIEVMSVGSISALSGAVGVGAAILCFEFLGGLSSVGIIDIIHCSLMAFSFFFMYILQSSLFGGFAYVLQSITANTPTVADAPSVGKHLEWILWTMPFVAFPLYPHLLTRLQGYHSAKGLRIALVALSLAPFLIIPGMLAFGISGRSVFPQLAALNSTSKPTSADIFALTIRLVMEQGSGYYFLGSLLFVGSMSVIMSTTSSNVSGVSAVIALDLYRPLVGSGSSVHVGRIISAVSALFLLSFAVVLSGIRLISTASWIGMLNGVILQLMPAFLLGLYSHFGQPLILNIGMICGIVTSVACHLGFAFSHSNVPADLGAFLGLLFNTVVVYCLSSIMSSDAEIADDSKSTGSITNVFSLRLSREASVEAPMNHKPSFGKFRTPMPSGLVGWRMNPNLDLNLDLPELSATEVSKFSSGSFAIDHARVGTTTLGSIGRIGDGHTEPIHNPVLLGASAIFLLLSSPFYFSANNAGISTNGIPFWLYLSFLAALMSSATLLYIMFSSWDLKDLQAKGSSHELSVNSLSVSTQMDNSVQAAESNREPSSTVESLPAPQLAITRFSSKGPKPFGQQSRLFYHDPKAQQPQPQSAEFRSVKNEKTARHKDMPLGRRQSNRRPERNDKSLPSMDMGSLESFSLEEEIRHHGYR